MTAKKKATLSALSDDAKAKLLIIVMDRLIELEKGGQLNSVLKQHGFSKDDSIAFLADLLDPEASKDLLLLSDRQLKSFGTDRNKLTWILEQFSNRPAYEPTREAFVGFVRYMSECWTEAFSNLGQKSARLTIEPRAYSNHELRKSSDLTESGLQSMMSKQLNLWQALAESDREEFRAYLGAAAAGQLKTLGEQLTVDQLTALGGLWNAATDRRYQSDSLQNLPTDLQQQVQPYTATGGLTIRFDSWAELYRAMGYNPTEGPKTQQRAHKAFTSLQDLKVPLVYRNMNPNQKRGDRKAIIEPAGSVIKTFYLPYESEAGKPSTDIVVWIREDFVRDAVKHFVQYPADLIEQIQEAARAAGYPRTMAFDILFVKWIYFADAERKTHKGKATLEGLADRLRLGQYLRSKRWGEIEERFARGLKIAIQGGWLLPESEIKDRKLIWKRNPEKFPGGKKTSPILSS